MKLDDEAIKALYEPHPCTGCSYREICAVGFACADFAKFLRSGKLVRENRIPSDAIHRRLFGG